jgi:prepilin-type N-terminal cleavage/methylation domain-containing protein
MTASAGRRGFTLVELLVVTGLIASLLGLVVGGMRSNGSDASQTRRSAQALASAFLATQSRAFGSPNGAGVIIDPVGVQGVVVSAALMHPMITGSITSGMPPADPWASSTTISLTPDNADPADVLQGYRIMLGSKVSSGSTAPASPSSPWLAFTPLTSASATVQLRSSVGQTTQNTIWPKNPASYATIARYPSKSDAIAAMDKAVAIDLGNSGVGTDPTTAFGQLHNKGAVAVTFDRSGVVAEVMQNVLASGARTVEPQTAQQPIYFLIAPRADIDNALVNRLSNPNNVWVTVFPGTGRVAVSANVPQTGTDATALKAARANATLGIPIGK